MYYGMSLLPNCSLGGIESMSITEVFGGKTSTLAAVCILTSYRVHCSKLSSNLIEYAVGVFHYY